MNTETANSLVEILTNISELQANLLATPDNTDAMKRLRSIRKTALAALNTEQPLEELQAAQRYEILDTANRLAALIINNATLPAPDSLLFRIGAAADNLARQVKAYADSRNHVAAMRMVAKNLGAPVPLEN